MRSLLTAIKATIVLTIVTGLIYPLMIWGLAQVMFPWQANGSLIKQGGRIVGSALIGQNFTTDRYFHPRPSAAGDKGYDAANSAGSNLGPTNGALVKAVRTRLLDVTAGNPGASAPQIPVDLVTASGSGLDPEISPAAARLQIPRVARARGLGQEQVMRLVAENTRGRWAGIIGEPGVNVLELNLALDRLKSGRPAPNRLSR